MYIKFSYILRTYDVFFFFKQKTAYEFRISDWSSDVCSSDLTLLEPSQLADLKGYSKVKFENSPVHRKSRLKFISGAKREDAMFAPSGMQIVKSLGKINVLHYVMYDIAGNEKISILHVNYTVNFAGFKTNTDFPKAYNRH